MALDYMLPIRIVQGLFALVVISLSSYVANWYDMDTQRSSPNQVNFLVAVPIFSLGSIAYLTLAPRFVPKASHPYIILGVEFLNALFYFAGFIALSVFVGSLLFCRGSVCMAIRADSAFGGFSWLLWTTTTGITIMTMIKGGSFTRAKGNKENRPMSQNPATPQP